MRDKPFIARPAMLRGGKRADSELGLECTGEVVTADGITIAVMEPSALANLVIRYRNLRFNIDCCPTRGEVRETLRRLAGMRQREAANRWHGLDVAVKVEINRAARVPFKCPHNLPELASTAMKTMEQRDAGRRRVKELANMFACELATFWYREKKQVPRVQVNAGCYAQTDFQYWATDLFTRAGFSVGDSKTLQAGVRFAKQSGIIPR